jgi:hypothetical protein
VPATELLLETLSSPYGQCQLSWKSSMRTSPLDLPIYASLQSFQLDSAESSTASPWLGLLKRRASLLRPSTKSSTRHVLLSASAMALIEERWNASRWVEQRTREK